MAAPTPYPDLNVLLGELVAGAQAALAASFCGAYLQGSFALGDADEHSDVDFVVVTHDELVEAEQAALQELHAGLYRREAAWAQHLEGSYAPKDRLRRVDPSRTPFFYLDNGARELIRDDHCNTAVVRWTLRERGVVLAGPDPKELLDPVPPGALRTEAVATMREGAAWARESRDAHQAGDGLAFSRWRRVHEPAAAGAVEETVRFVEDALRRAAAA